MPTTVTRKLSSHEVRFIFDNEEDAHRYTDPAVSALREAQAKVRHAYKLTMDAQWSLSKGQQFLGEEFLELMQLYFRLAKPETENEKFTYKEALIRIADCLSVVKAGLKGNLEITQLSQGECSKGTKGAVERSFSERVASVGYDLAETPFKERGAVESAIMINFKLLGINYPLAVNTLIHEAAHKFGQTMDHVYFGSGGRRINADEAWYAQAIFAEALAGNGERIRNLSSKDRTREQALGILQQAVQGDKEFEQVKKDLNQKAEMAGKNTFKDSHDPRMAIEKLFDSKWTIQTLTPAKALNNADSYSCFVYEMPVTAFGFQSGK